MHDGAPRKVIQHVIAPIAALVVVAMSVVVSFVWFSARNQDQIALRQSIESVQSAITRHGEQIGRVAKDYSWWNDAARNLVLDFDPAWADLSIGFYVFENHGYEMSFVVDGQDRTTYASAEDKRIVADAFETLQHGLHRLVAQARSAPLDRPEPAFGLLLSSAGDVLLVGLSTITPEESADFQLSQGPRSVLIYTKRIRRRIVGRDRRSASPDKPQSPPKHDSRHAGRTAVARPRWQSAGRTDLATPPAWHPVSTRRYAGAGDRDHLDRCVHVCRPASCSRDDRRDRGERGSVPGRGRRQLRLDLGGRCGAAPHLHLRTLRARDGETPRNQPRHAYRGAVPCRRELERWHQFLADLERWRPFRNVVSLCEDVQGIHRTVRLSGKPVLHTTGRPIGYRGTATDITAEIEAGRRAEYLAMHDALTRLPNRVLLLERLDQAIASVSRRRDMAALLLLDLDRFKDVNDTLGHPAGDLVLKEVAARLSACVREVDTVARIGGDEFAIVQVGIDDASEAQQLSGRLLELFQTPLEFDGHEALVTASVGVALIPTDASVP